MTVKRKDLQNVPELTKDLPLKQRILAALKQGMLMVETLAQELDEPSNKIRARISELSRAGVVRRFTGPDGSSTLYWGLTEQHHE